MKHYLRNYRYGSPHIVLQAPNGELLRWLKRNVSFSGNECLKWPFGRDPNGYPSFCRFDGHPVRGHRAMCILVHGHPPFPKAEAAHSCGRGHDACVAPNHLRWATHAENMADTVGKPRKKKRG